MEIAVNNNQFKKLFLDQISKISENGVLILTKNNIHCKTCTPDNSIILGIDFSIQTKGIEEEKIQINVGDIKKLTKAFDCIEGESFSFKIEKNNILYSDKKIKFKYHLLEDGIINQPKINLDKLKGLDFDCTFSITDQTINELIKASTFASDSNKIYLTSYDNILKGDLTDKTRYNIDSFEVVLTESFTGNKIENLCLNFEAFRIFSSSRFNTLQCKISSKLGVVLFGFKNNIISTQYIISALTK
jgi:hypothetical protein